MTSSRDHQLPPTSEDDGPSPSAPRSSDGPSTGGTHAVDAPSPLLPERTAPGPGPDPVEPGPAGPAAELPVPAADRAAAEAGRAVARIRRGAGLTLSAVAAASGLSTAYISQIESGTANPTVRTLAQVAEALGASLGDLFAPGAEERPGPGFAPRFAAVPPLARTPGHRAVWDLTAHGSEALSLRLVHADPGDHGEPVRHAGEEAVVVVAGRCRLHVGDTARTLGPGDACHFDAGAEHRVTDATDDLLLLAVLTGKQEP
ncbi:helix-turn-helix domain-containing protein [Streptomyces sp. NPDC001380]|uniref:helix-turn-helix domain-containing protein n=1 Tax=Streptomyces sp. NPDC001380 TaxID=3364566 RepID=UPI00369DFC6F